MSEIPRTDLQAAVERMKAERVQSRVRRMRGWETPADGRSLQRTYHPTSFAAGARFVAFVAQVAEELAHYPELVLRSDRLTITTRTDQVRGVTETDFELIERIDHRE